MALVVVLWLVDCDNDCDNNCNDDDNDDANEEAPPLLAVAAAGADNGSVDFFIALYNVLVDFLALLFNVGNQRLLLLYDLVEILEQLSKLNHLSLDILNCLVALLDIAESGASLATAV